MIRLLGDNRREIVTSLSHPYGIAVLEQYLYWTDWEAKSVQRVDKGTGRNRVTVRSELGNLMDIKAWKVSDAYLTLMAGLPWRLYRYVPVW